MQFHLAEDGNRTIITIDTASEEMVFARTGKDALLQKEKNDAVATEGYTKHIVNWVSDRMHQLNLVSCEFRYTGSPDAIEMTETELADYAREVVSNA